MAPASAQPPQALKTAATTPRWTAARLSPNAIFWIWAFATALWIGFTAHSVSTQGVAMDWWLVLEFFLLPLLGAAGVWRYGTAIGWRKGWSALDPLRWTRQHQVALLTTCVLGSIVGIAYAFAGFSANRTSSVPGNYFWVWLINPRFYWPWALIGAVIGGLTAYALQLLRSRP